MMRGALFACLACLAWPLAASADDARAIYVVAIGNNAPPAEHAELEPLQYADDDAVRFFELLGAAARSSALLASADADTRRRHETTARRAEPPTYAALKRTLERYRAAIAEDRARGRTPVVFLSFSGHGASDERGEPYLSLLDVPLTRTRLYEELLPLVADAEVHLFVDACRAEGVVGARGAFEVELEGSTVQLTEGERSSWLASRALARFPNVGALVASAANQETHEWSRLEAGVFSHELLSALRGAADANGDLKLAYSEVQAFISAANRDALDPRARPAMIAHLPQRGGDALLVDLHELSEVRLLHGDAGELGHFYIELDDGERLLDAHLSPGYRVALALPAQRACFVRTDAGEAEITKDASHMPLASLSFRGSTLRARGSVEHSLRDTLWKSAYGPVYYRGFVDSAGIAGVAFDAPAAIPDRAPSGWAAASRKRYALGLAGVAGAATIAFVASTWLTVAARQDFDATELEREADELREEHRRRLSASFATGAVAIAAGGGALAVWPWFSKPDGPELRVGVATQLRF